VTMKGDMLMRRRDNIKTKLKVTKKKSDVTITNGAYAWEIL